MSPIDSPSKTTPRKDLLRWLPHKLGNQHTYVTDVTDVIDVTDTDPQSALRQLSYQRFLDQFLTLILMVTSDFADSFGVMPYFTITALGSATPVQEVAYRRYIRYITWVPGGLNRCCTRRSRCLRITPRASSHVAWSVARSGSVQRLCLPG